MANEKVYTIGKVTTARPTMVTPSITVNGELVTVDDELNGYFLDGYKIYCDGSYLASVGVVKSIDLGQFSYPSISSYEIKIKAFAEYFNDSPFSNAVVFAMKGYDASLNDLGITATITANYRLSVNPDKTSADVCELL